MLSLSDLFRMNSGRGATPVSIDHNVGLVPEIGPHLLGSKGPQI